MRFLLFLLAFRLAWSALECEFNQIGTDVQGKVPNELFGSSVSLFGNRFAAGAVQANTTGSTRIYEFDNSSWAQLGLDIDGDAIGDQAGNSVSLFENRVAIGTSQGGYVRVYELLNDTVWMQLGSDLIGGNSFGSSVSLFEDRVAVGYPIDGANGTVRVYEFNGTDWTQIGSDMHGRSSSDLFGSSVSIFGDRVAIGASFAGYAQVYELLGSVAWSKLGNDLNGSFAGDRFGTSVSLFMNRVAVGAPALLTGYARVYQLHSGDSWLQLGSDLDGKSNNERFGTSVSLFERSVAIGAFQNSNNGSFSGSVRLYGLLADNSWAQLGSDINGNETNDRFGASVSLFENHFAVGAITSYGMAGSVSVYNYSCVSDCGNGILEFDEECDLGANNSNYGDCTENCTLSQCGDGWLNKLGLDRAEECDDANTVGADGCSPTCHREYACSESPNTLCSLENSSSCQVQNTCHFDTVEGFCSDRTELSCDSKGCFAGPCFGVCNNVTCENNNDCEPFSAPVNCVNGQCVCESSDNPSECGGMGCVQAFCVDNFDILPSPESCVIEVPDCDFGTCIFDGVCSNDPNISCTSEDASACVSNLGECVLVDVCGDGYKTGDEECDDGNPMAGDGCDACMAECDLMCQNLGTPCEQNSDCVVQATRCQDFGLFEACVYESPDGMTCPDGSALVFGQCLMAVPACEGICPDAFWPCNIGICAFVCSDGEINGDEECDDGNIFSGDGCDMMCQLENKTPTASRFFGV